MSHVVRIALPSDKGAGPQRVRGDTAGVIGARPAAGWRHARRDVCASACENPLAHTCAPAEVGARGSPVQPRAVISELHVCPAAPCRVIQTAERDAALWGCLTSFP